MGRSKREKGGAAKEQRYSAIAAPIIYLIVYPYRFVGSWIKLVPLKCISMRAIGRRVHFQQPLIAVRKPLAVYAHIATLIRCRVKAILVAKSSLDCTV